MESEMSLSSHRHAAKLANQMAWGGALPRDEPKRNELEKNLEKHCTTPPSKQEQTTLVGMGSKDHYADLMDLLELKE